MLKPTFIILAYLLISNRISSQDSTKTKRVKVLPVPAFGYSPETKTYIGAVTLFTFNIYKDTLTRTSNAKIEFNYTWRKQMILEGGWNYFFKDEKWFTKGLIHYSKYPDYYFGIGPNTPDSNKLTFNSNRFVFETYALKKIGYKLFTGIDIKYINYSHIKTESNEPKYSELTAGSTLGIGYSILKDTRNNILTPIKGMYLYGNARYNFAKTHYGEITLDFRYYKTWKNKYTLASRFVNDLNLGNPPFFDYAFLGGDKFVRGYYYGRYRDKILSSLQTEFRMPILKWLGLAAFGGISNLYSDVHPFKLNKTKYNAGVGLRILIDKKDRTNLRFDYALGNNNNNGFYVSFGESF
ncbi:MAG: hypothetical protein HYZ42_13920 [Bacteroidetes bacterium]|nr:hypothetical protein [Bacteroidota bacterium]